MARRAPVTADEQIASMETGSGMKICYYNHTGKVSGAEKVLFTLLDNIEPGVTATLVSPDTEPMRAFCRRRGIDHLPVDELKARFTNNPFRLVRYVSSGITLVLQVRKQIKRADPDIVHANSTRAGMIASLAMLGSKTPVVWHVHDQFKKHPITHAVRIVLASSRTNSVIAVSNATAMAVSGHSPNRMIRRVPITVIHNGVDATRYASRPDIVEKFLKTEALTGAAFRIAMVGQITPRKGQLEALETFARLVHSEAPKAVLLIVGTPVFNNDHLYLQRLLARTKELNMEANVRFMGHRKDIPVILQSCHLLIANSSSEPFSLVLLEACASATPILAAAVDGVPELIVDEVTGRLFAYGDSDTMLAALKQLNHNRLYGKALGMAARERILAHFTQEVFLAKVRQYYRYIAKSFPADIQQDKMSRISHNLDGYGQAPGWDSHDA